ncbi:hypothetical protein EDB84DRAFT_1564299 [Lactarius hengduanensis]|nr:hypothetical protein EDB84DRAFT_1564299 [Lactarius hengduanensis]
MTFLLYLSNPPLLSMDSAAVYVAPVVAPAPPGPRVLPFIGSALNLLSSYPWETFSDWGGVGRRRQSHAGAMTHITLFGQHYLVVNSLDTVLEGKSTIYSDRLGEMLGWKDGVVVDRYEERFQDLRRLLHQVMGTPASITKVIPVIEREVHRFLQRLLDAPPD